MHIYYVLINTIKLINIHYLTVRAFLVAELVKNFPAMQEIWVQSLGWDDPLNKEMAIHSSILAWRIPWTVQPRGLKELDRTEQRSLSLSRPLALSPVRGLRWKHCDKAQRPRYKEFQVFAHSEGVCGQGKLSIHCVLVCNHDQYSLITYYNKEERKNKSEDGAQGGLEARTKINKLFQEKK